MSSSFVITTPRFVELSTNPSMSELMVFIPFGYKYDKLIILEVVSSDKYSF